MITRTFAPFQLSKSLHSLNIYPFIRHYATTGTGVESSPSISAFSCTEAQTLLQDTFRVQPDFVTPEEELAIMTELEKVLQRMPYQSAHWDDAIAHFRETEPRSFRCPEGKSLLTRIPPGLTMIHALDLKEEGHVKPHIDSVRFSGAVICGLSLGSDCIMRLEQGTLIGDFLLKRRSFYTMDGAARFKFTHAIFAKGQESTSLLSHLQVERNRRISLVFRSPPPLHQEESSPDPPDSVLHQ